MLCKNWRFEPNFWTGQSLERKKSAFLKKRSLITYVVIHLSKSEKKNCSITNVFNNHTFKCHVFRFKNVSSFTLLSRDFFFFQNALNENVRLYHSSPEWNDPEKKKNLQNIYKSNSTSYDWNKNRKINQCHSVNIETAVFSGISTYQMQ